MTDKEQLDDLMSRMGITSPDPKGLTDVQRQGKKAMDESRRMLEKYNSKK